MKMEGQRADCFTEAVRGARVGRGGARGGGRGGFAGVNGNGAKKSDGPADAWPTTTATTSEEWNNQVEQSEAASAHEDDGGWGDEPAKETPAPTKPESSKVDFAAAAAKSVEQAKNTAAGAWGAGKPKSLSKQAPPTPAAAPVAPVAAAPAAPAPVAAAPVAAPTPVAAPAVPAVPAAKPKMTWAQIAKCVHPCLLFFFLLFLADRMQARRAAQACPSSSSQGRARACGCPRGACSGGRGGGD